MIERIYWQIEVSYPSDFHDTFGFNNEPFPKIRLLAESELFKMTKKEIFQLVKFHLFFLYFLYFQLTANCIEY